MARKLRLEYPGAIYHVINRGNYRAWVFRDEKTKAAFEGCLFEACVRCNWVLHAFVIMGNHYHLVLETPTGNLVVGMQWLQATFGNRFNKFRAEHGHVFQGRYKALLVEAGDALGQVCHYVHLNPVRAGIVTAADLRSYRFSSYWYLMRPDRRPKFLHVNAALAAAGQLPDSEEGRRSYQRYLEWQATDGPAGKNAAYVSMTKGWAIGGPEFKQALIKDHALAAEVKAWGRDGAQHVKQVRWEEALATALDRLPEKHKSSKRKSAAWKVAVAVHLKRTSDVSNHWLAQRLEMGSGTYVSKHVGLARRATASPVHALLSRIKGRGRKE